jgi:hypothetical protein
LIPMVIAFVFTSEIRDAGDSDRKGDPVRRSSAKQAFEVATSAMRNGSKPECSRAKKAWSAVQSCR